LAQSVFRGRRLPKFEFVINLRTAPWLSGTQNCADRADEVID
jgi:hypothetical protein